MMRLVDNPIQRYAWGSVEAIPRLLGVDPDGGPQAELWLGAHERAASRVQSEAGAVSLLDVVRRDPAGHLGPRWQPEGRLPFLAKVIATADPLSLQVHPDAECARRWFSEEEARGVGRTEPHRTCPDAVGKVEMVWALSRFRALCGFRPHRDMLDWLEVLDVDHLRDTARVLRRDGRPALTAEVARLLRSEAAPAAVAALRARAEELAGQPDLARSARVLADLARRYPNDPAVALVPLLRPLVLEPGEAMFVRTGQPHCYLSGTAFEVQANSDNVLRAGLTRKHVDVDQLVQALDTTQDGVAAIAGVHRDDEEVFAPATDRFALAVLRAASGEHALPEVTGPQVYFCVEGEWELDDGVAALGLPSGQSAYVPSRRAAVRVHGAGTLLRVTTGRSEGHHPAH
jgi:mannose-6-phosphate isomerase